MMPSGACVIRRDGKRGAVWYVKFVDAAGRQVKERLGPEADGWNERKAQRELRHRLADVERKGYRRPGPLTFATYSSEWLDEAERRRNWPPRTATVNRGAVKRLLSYFGPKRLAAIRPRDVAVYVREALLEYAPATVNLDMNVLVDVFNSAIREELVETNPAAHVERPRVPRRRWRILEPAEVARLAKAFDDEQAGVMFLTLVLTGLRRFELLALRWRDVDMLEDVLRVRDSKSEDGIRSIALTKRLSDELRAHRGRTAFRGDDEYVFCHPERGTPYSPKTFDGALSGRSPRPASKGTCDRSTTSGTRQSRTTRLRARTPSPS